MVDKILGLHGPLCARGVLEFPPASSLFVQYRDLQWWQDEQARSGGMRHGGRFFPRLMRMEKCLDEVAGGSWKLVARDRPTWRRLREAWTERMDIAWTRMNQLSLQDA